MIGLDFGFPLSARYLVVLGAAAASVATSDAQPVTLNSLNSSAQINVSTGGPAAPGMSSWVVDGVNQVNQQWFYYRLGSGGLSFSGPAAPIESISGGAPTSVLQTDPNRLSVVYANANLSVQVDYTLTGLSAGSDNSKLLENVTFKNLSGDTTYLQLLDYADYNLAGTAGGQSGRFYAGASGNTYFQTLGAAALTNKLQSTISGGGHLSEWQADLLSNNLLGGLLNGTITTLNNNATAGVGDVTAGSEWDVALAPSGSAGSSLGISETIGLTQVPEPSSLALLGVGLLLAVRRGAGKRAGIKS